MIGVGEAVIVAALIVVFGPLVLYLAGVGLLLVFAYAHDVYHGRLP